MGAAGCQAGEDAIDTQPSGFSAVPGGSVCSAGPAGVQHGAAAVEAEAAAAASAAAAAQLSDMLGKMKQGLESSGFSFPA